jgi:formamidopyrimidine-DNA glycosylase
LVATAERFCDDDGMPELPDIALYIEALAARVSGAVLQEILLHNAFLLRTAEPPLEAACGKRVLGLRRMGKRIVFELEGSLFLVFHLMIAGRLKWTSRALGDESPGAVAGGPEVKPAARKRPAGGSGLATFIFSTGTLVLTEAGTKRRASLHLMCGEESCRALDPGGLEVLEASLATFRSVLDRQNHTLKRALTDPRLFSGIGNAHSDEILFRARLSPFRQTHQLSDEEAERLYNAIRAVLTDWIDMLRAEVGDGFPSKVTAFRAEMAVHGRYRQPCPDCGTPVQRIVYAENEANYCARCQTGGRLLADRALSRLLKGDWPRTIEELEGKGP